MSEILYPLSYYYISGFLERKFIKYGSVRVLFYHEKLDIFLRCLSLVNNNMRVWVLCTMYHQVSHTLFFHYH